jgi:hypothetical protein
MEVVLRNRLVPEHDGAATVGLQTMLVRVDHHRVALCDRGERPTGDTVWGVVRNELEEASIGSVDVHAHPVGARQSHDLVDRVDCAQTGRASGSHHGAEPAGAQLLLERIQVHGPVGRARDADGLDSQDVAHAAVGVVRVPR